MYRWFYPISSDSKTVVDQLRLDDKLKPDKKRQNLSKLLKNLRIDNKPLVADGFVLLHPTVQTDKERLSFEDSFEPLNNDEGLKYNVKIELLTCFFI